MGWIIATFVFATLAVLLFFWPKIKAKLSPTAQASGIVNLVDVLYNKGEQAVDVLGSASEMKIRRDKGDVVGMQMLTDYEKHCVEFDKGPLPTETPAA